MPLNTRIERNGEVLKIEGGWTWFALSAFLTAAFAEDSPEMEYDTGKKFKDLKEGCWVDFSMAPVYYMKGARVIERGVQTLTKQHMFCGPDQVIILEPGDVLIASRSHR